MKQNPYIGIIFMIISTAIVISHKNSRCIQIPYHLNMHGFDVVNSMYNIDNSTGSRQNYFDDSFISGIRIHPIQNGRSGRQSAHEWQQSVALVNAI